MSGRRLSLLGAIACAVVLAGSLLVLATGDDPPTEETRLGQNTSTTARLTTTSATAPDEEAPPPALEDVRVALDPVIEMNEPTATALRDDESGFYVAERAGRVYAIRDGEAVGPLLDISDSTTATGEQGLLGIAFSPNGDRLYMHSTTNAGDTRVDEYAVDPRGVIDGESRRNLLAIEQPFTNHNGGHVVVGPDGLLYVGLGDGGSQGDPDGNGQDTSTLLGSILRIDPTPAPDGPYSVPADNPFVGRAPARPEIYVHGLRNPWRFSFDEATGDLWIGDVGTKTFEEVDHLPAGRIAGANLGWSLFEGSEKLAEPDPDGPPVSDPQGPTFEYPTAEGCAITGGVVYRGSAIPDLVGSYVYADFCAGELRALALDDSGEVRLERSLGVGMDQVAHFGVDRAGEILVLSLGGRISRLVPVT